jgi:ABC-type polysaccharide/polyol phosphate transport system ATPase subunit
MNMLTVSNPPPSQPDQGAIISLQNVSVHYRVPRERVSGIKEYTIRWLQKRLHFEEFLALKDISFHVQRGEAFGVIGRNGSGKSTLLKVVARVLVPQQGRVITCGAVAPLLELSAGFQPELTGRENIFLNSALLGRSKKLTEELLPEIIEFAEIGDFIDAPVRTYSTGMVARLGFSVATSMRPDILLVDEVLSVGDAQFQEKCLDRMNSFRAQGTTILFVSHSMATVETFCENALLLDKGHVTALGPADEVIAHYTQGSKTISVGTTAPPLNAAQISANIQHFTSLHEIGKIYLITSDAEHLDAFGPQALLSTPGAAIFNPEQGSVSGWLNFLPGRPHPDSVIFHTNDSRFVLYTTNWTDPDTHANIRVIIARAGGNRRALDTFYGTSSFPETSVALYDAPMAENTIAPLGPSFPEGEWHLVTMTWNGYPEGSVRIYIDAQLIGEHAYGSQYDDGRAACHSFAVGMRPSEWTGEVVQGADGSHVDLRPHTSMSVEEGGLELQDLRLYKKELTPLEIQAIFSGGIQPPPSEGQI